MEMRENANFIQILEGLGWTGEQINKFMLGIAGRLSISETVRLINLMKKKDEQRNE
ncbi:MAG: hypothetical protein II915_07345 [Eubacterium sp.]|nr:hypothetical protein [Eubacterium sp.]MBR0118738.1 hypothetical protein [Eubacterium sp.]